MFRESHEVLYPTIPKLTEQCACMNVVLVLCITVYVYNLYFYNEIIGTSDSISQLNSSAAEFGFRSGALSAQSSNFSLV